MRSWLFETVWGHVDFHPSDRERMKTAWVMLGGLLLFGLWFGWRGGWSSAACIGFFAAAPLLGFGMMAPALGLAIYRVVMGAAGLMGYFMSHVILFAIFYVVFTSVSLIMRAMRKDLLDRRGFGESKAHPTAWRGHKPPGTKRQYHRLS